MYELPEPTTIQGTPKADRLVANADNQTLEGLGGNDSLLSGFNFTTLDGGDGNDQATANITTRQVGLRSSMFTEETENGGDGNDTLTATAVWETQARGGSWGWVSNHLNGDKGNDALTATARTFGLDLALTSAVNYLDGGIGNDVLKALAVDEHTRGGNDYTAINKLWGGAGNDAMTAAAQGAATSSFAANYLDGGDGNDALTGTSIGGRTSFNTLAGGAGNDSLSATAESLRDINTSARNTLDGGTGNDTLTAKAVFRVGSSGGEYSATNALRGGDGDDILLATIVDGSMKSSELFGGAGDDRLTVVGGNNNRLADGAGTDRMTGGEGKDFFVLTAGDTTLDTLVDFSGATGDQDKVDLTAFGSGAQVYFDATADVLAVNGEQVAQIFGTFDPATDILVL